MASIFKKFRDKNRRRSYWYVSYDDENGRRRMKKGFTDRRAKVPHSGEGGLYLAESGIRQN